MDERGKIRSETKLEVTSNEEKINEFDDAVVLTFISLKLDP